MSKFLKQAMGRQRRMASGSAAKDAAFQKAFPILYEFLTVTELDGQPRERSKVTWMDDGGTWKAALNDPHTEATLWVVADSVEGLWKALEASLASEEGNWRAWTGDWRAKRPGGKGKKT